jgi:hypothetical protein
MATEPVLRSLGNFGADGRECGDWTGGACNGATNDDMRCTCLKGL